MAGSLNDYEALTAALGGQDATDADFDVEDETKRRASLQVASRVANGQLTVEGMTEVLNMLGLMPGQETGPTLTPSKTFNPTMDAKGN